VKSRTLRTLARLPRSRITQYRNRSDEPRPDIPEPARRRPRRVG